MRKEITIPMTEDLEVLCDVFRCTPQELLQAFADSVSLPRFLNGEQGQLLEASTNFFLLHAPTRDSEQVQERLDRNVTTAYCARVVSTAGPESEEKLRAIVKSWCEAASEERRKFWRGAWTSSSL